MLRLIKTLLFIAVFCLCGCEGFYDVEMPCSHGCYNHQCCCHCHTYDHCGHETEG
jgi:hypothetical protein